MDKNFDFAALLQNHGTHKYKPVQFSNVANGVRKRLDSNIKRRKSSRLTVFDKIRNIQPYGSPIPKTEQQEKEDKYEHRRLQLEKWKEEKEKKKKEVAKQRKKPFVVGVVHAPVRYVPPPPPRVMPSTSGRVTRSRSAQNKASKQGFTKNTVMDQSEINSFAPANATFHPPEMKHIDQIPILSMPKRRGIKGNIVKFNPVTSNVTKSSSVNNICNDKSKLNKKPILLQSSTSTESGSSFEDFKVKTPKKCNDKISEKKKSIISINSSSETSLDSPVMTKKSPQRLLGKKKPSELLTSNSDSSIESPVKSPIKLKHKSTPFKRTPLKPIPKSESSSEERLRSPKSPVDVPMTPEQITEEAKKISPCVTMSRGKDNARREMKQKIAEGLLDEDLNDMDNIEHFKKQLDSEIKRLTEMCETWDKILDQVTLPELVQEAVLSAVGQARLLMTQKFQQFAGLVARCEVPDSAQPLVTAADLHGFWDMVFMQVVNVDMRFKKLEEMKARGWTVEEQTVEVKRKVIKPKVTKPAATSRLRDMIAAARKAKKDEEPKSQEPQESGLEDSKTFEAGFFSVRSPVRCAAPVTPHRPTLLKAVLSSEAQKASASKNTASMAMLRASMLGKSVEKDSISGELANLIQFSPVNLNATPGRSILKSTAAQSKKSIKCVLFDSSDSESLDDSINKEDISGVQKLEETLSMDSEKENEKKLVRQDAIKEWSPIMTRNRRKSLQTPIREDRERILQESALKEWSPIMTRNRKKSLQTPIKENRERILQESDLNTPRLRCRSTRK